MAGEDGDAVVGLLGDGDALVADVLEDGSREVGALQLLKQEDIGAALLEPRKDMLQSCIDGIDVPAGDDDGSAPFLRVEASGLDTLRSRRAGSHEDERALGKG